MCSSTMQTTFFFFCVGSLRLILAGLVGSFFNFLRVVFIIHNHCRHPKFEPESSQSCGSCSFGCVVTLWLHPRWSNRKWTALRTGVNAPKMHWEPTAQTRAARDHILSAVCTQFVLSHIEGLPIVMQMTCLGSLTCQAAEQHTVHFKRFHYWTRNCNIARLPYCKLCVKCNTFNCFFLCKKKHCASLSQQSP